MRDSSRTIDACRSQLLNRLRAAKQRDLEKKARDHARGTKALARVCPRSVSSLQKSIEDVVREGARASRQWEIVTLAQSGRPRRVKRRRMSDHGGKAMRSTSTEGVLRGNSPGNSLGDGVPERECPSRQHFEVRQPKGQLDSLLHSQGWDCAVRKDELG
jgi:hypothetical protein